MRRAWITLALVGVFLMGRWLGKLDVVEASMRGDQLVQWAFTVSVPAFTDMPLSDNHRLMAVEWNNVEAMPMDPACQCGRYTVPGGLYLGLTGAHLSTKFAHSSKEGFERSSYLVLSDVMTITENPGGAVSFPQPLVLPPGASLRPRLINNAAEQQWMTVVIFGVLRQSPDRSYRGVFRDWFVRGLP